MVQDETVQSCIKHLRCYFDRAQYPTQLASPFYSCTTNHQKTIRTNSYLNCTAISRMPSSKGSFRSCTQKCIIYSGFNRSPQNSSLLPAPLARCKNGSLRWLPHACVIFRALGQRIASLYPRTCVAFRCFAYGATLLLGGWGGEVFGEDYADGCGCAKGW